jgi:hypothetical protein
MHQSILIAVVVGSAFPVLAEPLPVNANGVYSLCIDIYSQSYERSGEPADTVARAVQAKCTQHLDNAVNELVDAALKRDPRMVATQADRVELRADAVSAITAKGRERSVLKVIELRSKRNK